MPDVVAICLTADRQELTERAVRCFERQTYNTAWMLIYDTGREPFQFEWRPHSRRVLLCRPDILPERPTIGQLRNDANTMARRPADSQIFLHWDSDDWSDARRIETQVAQLTNGTPAVGAVGFRELLFWRRRDATCWMYRHQSERYAAGASLCYWASCWDQLKFEHTNKGEDTHWLRGVWSRGYAGLTGDDPLMVAELHGANTSSHEPLEKTPLPEEFTRRDDMDDRVKRILEAA